MEMDPLPLARYRFEFTVEKPLTLPAFAGSTLRGAFGGTLRATTCMTRQKNCDGCPLLMSCPYALVFEPRPPRQDHPLQDFNQIPRPYIIEPPEWGEKTYTQGETLSFHLVLAGHAISQLPLVTWAFHRAFQRGVGRGDGTARLARIFHICGEGEALILEGLHDRISDHPTTQPLVMPQIPSAVTLHFDSPLRLQTNGRRATAEEFTPRKLLTALIRRIALIHEFHGAGPLALDFKTLAMQADALVSDKQLQWRDWTRYSSRQQQKMNLGGVIGTWQLNGDLAPFLPFLHLGQWLHVGKEAVFGLGGYRLELHA